MLAVRLVGSRHPWLLRLQEELRRPLDREGHLLALRIGPPDSIAPTDFGDLLPMKFKRAGFEIVHATCTEFAGSCSSTNSPSVQSRARALSQHAVLDPSVPDEGVIPWSAHRTRHVRTEISDHVVVLDYGTPRSPISLPSERRPIRRSVAAYLGVEDDEVEEIEAGGVVTELLLAVRETYYGNITSGSWKGVGTRRPRGRDRRRWIGANGAGKPTLMMISSSALRLHWPHHHAGVDITKMLTPRDRPAAHRPVARGPHSPRMTASWRILQAGAADSTASPMSTRISDKVFAAFPAPQGAHHQRRTSPGG